MILINHWFYFVFSLQNFNCSLLIKLGLLTAKRLKKKKKKDPYVWIFLNRQFN
jgi:hypothetical protein